jgi:hypothetical protein
VSRAPDTVRVLALPGVDSREWLLPAVAVVEIVSAQGLEPADAAAPEWLIGSRQWRGVSVPTVRIGKAPRVAAGAGASRGHPYLAICLGASDNAALPFFAIESPGLPRMELVGAQSLVEDAEASAADHPFALALLSLNGRPAALADLRSLESRLLAARPGG